MMGARRAQQTAGVPYTTCLACRLRFYSARPHEECPGCGTLVQIRAPHRAASLERHLIEAQAIAQIGSWEWDIDTDGVIWSPELYAIYELDPESAIEGYEAFLDRVHPDDRREVDQAIRDAYTARASFAFEHRTRPVDGRSRVLRARGRIVMDEDGAPRRMVGTAQVVPD